MSRHDAFERLRAWDEGRAIANGHTLPWLRADAADRLVLAFVRMGGESSPWGLCVGRPDAPPEFFTCAEPRNADLHAAFVLAAAGALLRHVEHPSLLADDERLMLLAMEAPLRARVRLRQLWVPGPSHLDMLHFLDFRYTHANTGDPKVVRRLQALGRVCGWLFRESTRPGQVRVFDATARLRRAYTFPAEPVRQAHLGYLLAWLEADRTRDERLAEARAREDLPVSVTMSPEYERATLEPLVTRYNAAKDDPPAQALLAREIHDALVPELRRRWELTVQAMAALDADPRASNPHLDAVVDLGSAEYFHEYWKNEAKGLDPNLSDEQRRYLVHDPETDYAPARAARRYFAHLHAAELAAGELVHGDATLVEQSLDAGNALRGTIRAVEREAVAGKKSGPILWTIECSADDSLRLREETSVCLVGARKRIGRIRSLATVGAVRTVVLQMTDGLTKRSLPNEPDAADASALVGATVTFLEQAAAGFTQMKIFRVGHTDGPGAWLTHAAPLPEPSPPVRIQGNLLDLVKSLQ
ncbi:MAG: hypothetical protein Q8S73_22875 [Deltaproteobacteria bacterium]|nr:hypothetical protein [Myxococcales bacterium]MDP3216973.1 hypothetical protein [Deltaproteobacteria bacterium]